MSPFAYLVPYANHHAFESAMGPKAYTEALDEFLEAIPKSMSRSDRDLLVGNWQIAFSRYRAQSGQPAIG